MLRHRLLTALVVLALPLVGCDEATTAVDEGTTPASSGTVVAPSHGPSGPTNVQHFNAHGDAGFIFWRDGAVRGFLRVSQTRSGQDRSAFLSYSVVDCSTRVRFRCVLLANGFGEIPLRDLRGSGGGSLRLETDLSANPDFTVRAGPAGVVAVEWSKTDDFWLHRTGTSQSVRFGVRTNSSGTFTSSSAEATGSVVGQTIAGDVNASIRKNQNVRVTIQM